VFRTTLKVAAGAAMAVAALTACGPVRTGSAALIGDDRITTAKLDDTVHQWNKEFARDATARADQEQGVVLDAESAPRSALYELITLRVWDQVGRRQNIEVAQGNVDSAISGVGRPRVTSRVVAVGLPGRYTDAWMRAQLIEQTLLARLGHPLREPQTQDEQLRAIQAEQQTSRLFSETAKAMDIKVNPRYGTYDPAKLGSIGFGTLLPVRYELSRPDSRG
jgi:hypothetical protein